MQDGPLYGLVAWPSPELDSWLRREQQRLQVRSYGEPHLNLRAPFYSACDEAELVASLRRMLSGCPPFEVQLTGWRTFPHVVFLECRTTPALEHLHQQVLTLPCAPPQPFDHKEYIPHLTLALGVMSWAEPALHQELERMPLPVSRFPVTALSLTREDGGELREVHTFPLGQHG